MVLATGLFLGDNIALSQTNSESKATSGQIQTSSSAAVIDQTQLVGLPMNGRSYTQLATLEAGVSDPSGGGRQGGTGSSLTVSGGRGEWNSFLLDGTDINDAQNQVPQSAAGGQLGADSLLEVQVFSTNYGAQYGRAAGGVMNAVTRSGSNDLHGTLFEFFRNSKLDARNFFDKGSDPPPFKRNQFGATLTGPITKGNTFFMASFESLFNRLTETYVSFVPDSAVRQGTLSLPGRDSIHAVPQVLPYLSLYPLPDQAVLDSNGRPTGVAENRTAARLPTTEYFFVGRVDKRLAAQDALFGRYSFDDASNTNVGSVPDTPRVNESRQQYLTVAETHFFTTALLNTTRFGYTRPVSQIHVRPVREIPRSLFFVPTAPQYGGIFVTGLTVWGATPEAPAAKTMNSFQASDDLISSRGAHTLKLGISAERFQWNVFDSQNLGGLWTFSGLENFLLAGPTATKLIVALPGSDAYRAFRQALFGFYLQDDFRVRPNLTLNLGVRYELTTIIHDTRRRSVHLVDELHDTQPQLGPLMQRNPSLRNFAPRLGLSWSPAGNRRTVIRAGFGVYHDEIIEYSVDRLRNTIPFYQQVVLPNFDSSKTFPDAVAAAAGIRAKQLRIFEYSNPRTPVVYRYNLSLEKEIASGLRMEASYLGARGNHLLRTLEANQFPFPTKLAGGSLYFPPDPDPDPKLGPDNSMNPAFGSIEKVLTDAQSFYHSFIVSVDRRLWKGFSLAANYTYSKSVDDASSAGDPQQQYGLDRKLNRGLSSFDTRHRFSLRYFYNLPPATGWLSQMLGNWRLGGILTARTGQTADVEYNIPAAGFLFVSQRPNLRPAFSNNPVQGMTSGCSGVEAGRKLGSPNLYFDPCAFSVPAPGTIGNVGRRTLVGPRVVNLDFSLQKEFAIDSKRRLQFRAELFNVLNHANFRGPATGSGTTVFRSADGRVSPSAGKLTSTATTPRQIQFALRFSF